MCLYNPSQRVRKVTVEKRGVNEGGRGKLYRILHATTPQCDHSPRINNAAIKESNSTTAAVIRTDLLAANTIATIEKTPAKTNTPAQSHNIIIPETNVMIDRTRQILATLIFI
jgi:hypothetical protein